MRENLSEGKWMITGGSPIDGTPHNIEFLKMLDPQVTMGFNTNSLDTLWGYPHDLGNLHVTPKKTPSFGELDAELG